MTVTPAQLVGMVDHTLLSPTATPADVAALAAEAAALGTYSICVSPAMLPLGFAAGVKVATVCGFPSGKHVASIKAAEAAQAVADGADEVDMVIDLGLVKAGSLDSTQAACLSELLGSRRPAYMVGGACATGNIALQAGMREISRHGARRAVVLGAVQVPPGGDPVVLLADHPPTGGYPVLAVVHPDDLWQCGQARPGDRLRFTSA